MSEEKEIIIDGVDVKICKHYDIDNNYCDQSYLGEGGLLKNTKNPKRCQQSPNCYFKQLKRLQQDNKALKSLLDFEIQKREVFADKSIKYEFALEEIRKKITPVCADCNNIDGFTTWDDCENVCEKGVIKYLKIIDEVLNDRD